MALATPAGPQRVGVVIVAAGQSRRMEGIDKVFAPVLGRSLLAWTVEVYERSPVVDEIVIALDRRKIEKGRVLAQQEGWRKVSQLCRGGMRRQDSVREALWRIGKCDWVAIHDGARPCAEEGLLLAGLEAAQETGAAVPALPMTDTLKRADAHGLAVETLDRANLWTVQTPQIFRYAILWAAYQQSSTDVTDDAALVELMGHQVRLFPGSRGNIKVTVPEDLVPVAACLQERQRKSESSKV